MNALLLIAAILGAEPTQARAVGDSEITWELCGKSDHSSPFEFIVNKIGPRLTVTVWENRKQQPPVMWAGNLKLQQEFRYARANILEFSEEQNGATIELRLRVPPPGMPIQAAVTQIKDGKVLMIPEKGYLSCEERGFKKRSPIDTPGAEPEAETRSAL